MKRRDFLKIFGIGLATSIAARAAKARVCERNVGTLRAIYPVGAIYISTINTNPADLFGFGTWQRFGNGRALVGVDEGNGNFNTVQRIGGSATHTLTTAQIPSHSHSMIGSTSGVNGTGSGATLSWYGGWRTGDTGGGGAHNNLQPYITVFMWRRSA